MTIEELLSEPNLSSMKIIVGQNGSKRMIETVQTIETQIISRYHQPSMLYILDNQKLLGDETEFGELLGQLDRTDAAGIAIMPNQVMYVTDKIEALANQYELPIIVMPQLPSFSDGMQLFFEAMMNNHTKQLRKVIENNQELADFVLDDPEVDRVLDVGADMMQTPIILLNSHFQAAYVSKALKPQQAALTEFFRNTDIDYFQLEQTITIDYGENSFTLFPLFPAFKENKAFVGIENYQENNTYLLVLRQLILNTMSFVNSRIDMVNESNFRNLSGFFLNVLDGGLSEDLLNHRLLDLGLNPRTKYTCAITDMIGKEQGRLVSNQLLEQIQQLMMWFINEYQLPVVLFSWRQQFVLLINESENPKHVIRSLQQFIISKIPESYRFIVGYSNAQETLDKMRLIFNEANEAIRTAKQNPQSDIEGYAPKYIHELVSLIPEDEAETFYQTELGPLLEMDNQEEQKMLLETLSRYFYYGEQVSQVAKSLFLHRNTVLYRLKKVQQILDIDLDDPQEAQNINFALLLYDNH